LASTYLTLSFAEVAEKTNLPVDSLENSLRDMVQTKAIKARINKKQNTVDFIGDEAENDDQLVSQRSFNMTRTVEQQNLRIVQLLARVKDANEKIRRTDDFTTSMAKRNLKKGDENNFDDE